jgi:hypothetical protein
MFIQVISEAAMESPRRSFMQHRNGAKYRGIPFEFTFEEWVKWWEDHLGPDWQSKRGIYRGQFQMARNKDKGPYSAWNVTCKTTEQNSSDRKENISGMRGEDHFRTTLTEDEVLVIRKITDGFVRMPRGSYKLLTKRFGVTKGVIQGIKRRKTWKHI